MIGWPQDDPFFSSPDCVLYVRSGDPGVVGSGIGLNLPTASSSGGESTTASILYDLCGRALQPSVLVDVFQPARRSRPSNASGKFFAQGNRIESRVHGFGFGRRPGSLNAPVWATKLQGMTKHPRFEAPRSRRIAS